MKILPMLLLILAVIMVLLAGGYFAAKYYLSTQVGPEYLFMHPTMSKIFGLSPVCSTVCVANGGVCGKDGKEYCNQCVAFQNGAGYAHDGSCNPVTTVDPTAGWLMYSDIANGVELKYPATFSGAVWSAQTWPPVVTVVNNGQDPLQSCGQDISSPGQGATHENITINNMNFVLYKGSDAGAGQLYSDYCYILNANNKNYVINFVIHSTNGCGNGNCGPWCGTPNETACKSFDMQKEVEQPIGTIVGTFKFTK